MLFKSRKHKGDCKKRGTEVQCKAICMFMLVRSVLELHPTAIAGLSFLSSTYRCVEDIRMVQRDKMNSL